jgi:hypothetical protein
MVEKGAKAKSNSKIAEPSILIRPITRLGGLDNIHVALLALVAILIALLLLVSYYKPVAMPNNSTSSALTTTIASNISLQTVRNASTIKHIAEQMLASYVPTNSSLSVLPFYSNVSGMSESYVPALKAWYVQVPATEPGSSTVVYMSALISDTNGSVLIPFLQIPKPQRILSNYVASDGVIRISGQPACIVSNSTQIYWFMDPYSAGAVQSLRNVTALEQKYGSSVNISLEMLFGSASQNIASQTSVPDAQALGQYLFCASQQQPRFAQYVSLLNNVYSNSYISSNELQGIASTSGMNQTQFNSCLGNYLNAFSRQSLLAGRYNITASPSIVVNCDTLAIPQTVNKALCYANGSFC